jgi:hypothetical protein
MANIQEKANLIWAIADKLVSITNHFKFEAPDGNQRLENSLKSLMTRFCNH